MFRNFSVKSETSVVTIPDVAMRYISRYFGHDAIRIAILVYRVIQCLYLHIFFIEAWQLIQYNRYTSTYKYS